MSVRLCLRAAATEIFGAADEPVSAAKFRSSVNACSHLAMPWVARLEKLDETQ